MARPSFKEIAELYANRRRLTIVGQLGFGVQGMVFHAKNQANGAVAVKIHSTADAYLRERNVYFRLTDNGVDTVFECAVPELIHFDDELLALEMTVVDRPYCLDFGGAYLDEAPPFSDDILAAWEAEKAEQFGPRWSQVVAILKELERYGIYVIDVNPNNISWPAE